MEKVTATKRNARGKTIIKKRVKKFRRHQSDQFIRVPVSPTPSPICLPASCAKPWLRWLFGAPQESWRRPKGMESRVRMKFNGQVRLQRGVHGVALSADASMNAAVTVLPSA